MKHFVTILSMVAPALVAAAPSNEPATAALNSKAAPATQIRHYGAGSGLPFSLAEEVNGTLYLSGQIGARPGKGTIVSGGIVPQAQQTMENIGSILRANGLTFDDVFKCTVMLADMADWSAFNKVYSAYFKPGHFPARSAFGASGLAFGARLELECWARTR